MSFTCAKCGIIITRYDDKYNEGYCDDHAKEGIEESREQFERDNKK